MEAFKPFVINNACGERDCLYCTVRRMQVCCVKDILPRHGLPEEIVDIILWKVFDDKGVHRRNQF